MCHRVCHDGMCHDRVCNSGYLRMCNSGYNRGCVTECVTEGIIGCDRLGCVMLTHSPGLVVGICLRGLGFPLARWPRTWLFDGLEVRRLGERGG